jgi:GT2 family glycosyltransferase
MLKYTDTTMDGKVGIGIITCDRSNYVETLLDSLPDITENIVIINDGVEDFENKKQYHTIKHNPPKQGVGKTKNDAMQYLLDQDCEHIFIIEDDVKILDSNVFEQYIQAAKQTGILHFNFGPGTPFNRTQRVAGDVHNRHLLDQNSKPNPRLIVDYKNVKLALYLHIAGTFSYFHRSVLEKTGLIDEQFYNAWDHVEHTYRIIKDGFHPPFWWFADIANSDELLAIQSAALDNSAIAKSDEWYNNLRQGMEKYRLKHGWVPNQTPQVSQQTVIKHLKHIKENTTWMN